jgi:hypothetical protein
MILKNNKSMDLLKLLDVTFVMFTIAMLVQRIRDRRGW